MHAARKAFLQAACRTESWVRSRISLVKVGCMGTLREGGLRSRSRHLNEKGSSAARSKVDRERARLLSGCDVAQRESDVENRLVNLVPPI
jgi:hypothetical protein